MRASTKSQDIPQLAKDPAESTNNLMNNTKTESPEVPNLKLPSKNQEQKEKMSLSRKIYIVTDHQDQIVESIPTAKHTFMSEQVEMTGEKFDGYYTSRKRDEKQSEKDKEKAKFGIEPDMKSDINHSKASAKTKGQRSRFYYKAEEYDSLDQVQVPPKEKSTKELSVKPESVKQDTVRKSVKENNEKQKSVNQQVAKEKSVKDKSVKDQSLKQKSVKPQSVKQQQLQQTPKSNTKMMSSYISKMNKSQSPYQPLQEQTQGSPFKKKPHTPNQFQPQQQNPYQQKQPRSSRFSQPRSNSPLQQSHQKLFNKCYKQTYSHLKLMLREIHQSQQQMHIIHKEITDTVFEIIKERAQAIRQEMNQLVQEIVTQWMKDEWQFVKESQMEFMDDILELENQLNQREKEINGFVDRLVRENKKQQANQDENQEIFHTFNGKHNVRNSMKSARTETTWKKVTTDLLMFNYESNIIEIQEMIQKISKTSLDKCNKAVDMLPSSELFAVNSHQEILNKKAKKWFKQTVLTFMNQGTTEPAVSRASGINTHSSPPRDSSTKPTLLKTYQTSKKQPPPKQYQQYQQIVQSIKAQQQDNPNRRYNRQDRVDDYYPSEQEMIERAYREESARRRKEKEASPRKVFLDKTYYASGRGGYYS